MRFHEHVHFITILANETDVVDEDEASGPALETKVQSVVEELALCDTGGLHHRRRRGLLRQVNCQLNPMGKRWQHGHR